MSNSIKIMVEDCHSLYLDTFTWILKKNGFNVIGSATNANEFITAISSNNLPDIAIIDYKSSRPETFDTARWLKIHYPNIKVVINTLFNIRIPFAEFKQLGIEGVIIKANHDITQILLALHLIYYGKNFYPENCPSFKYETNYHQKQNY